MKVVFDTNILVSALVFPGGNGEAALERVIAGHDELLISKAIVEELLGVLARKFARDTEELAHVAVFMESRSTLVKPSRRLYVLKDGPDNRILECGVAGKADVIVTGDRQMLALGEYRGIRIISLRNYLNEG